MNTSLSLQTSYSPAQRTQWPIEIHTADLIAVAVSVVPNTSNAYVESCRAASSDAAMTCCGRRRSAHAGSGSLGRLK